MSTNPSTLSKQDALRAYARMMHHLSVDHIEPLLADDFHYTSQWVFSELSSKQQYLDYIRPKIGTIKSAGRRVWAELSVLQHSYPDEPCLVIAQDEKDNLVATVLVKVAEGKIQRFDMCMVPPPQSARRTGEYPI